MAVGTAGWTIARACAVQFPGTGSHLERYARVLDVAEINSSFHRPHRRSTWERWAASVPAGFRFSVKLPKSMTHERRLVGCDDLLAAFAHEVGGLGDRRGPLLVQLPPSLAFDAGVATAFLASAAAHLGGAIVLEARHASWFEPEAELLLADLRVARVAADPARVPAAGEPGGWLGLAYYRLHGSPQVFRSAYGPERVAAHAARLDPAVETWTIFDNTASGAATADALMLARILAAR